MVTYQTLLMLSVRRFERVRGVTLLAVVEPRPQVVRWIEVVSGVSVRWIKVD